MHYLPGNMKVHDLDPPVYRATELVDLHLGRAVQAAWEQGKQDAKAGHEAEQAIGKHIAQRYQGQAAC